MAKTLKLSELNKQYKFVCLEWVQKFANKQGIDFDYWIADEIGGVASFCEHYFFNLSDIILDINTKQPKGLIIQWQEDGVEYNFAMQKEHINYKSYTMGLRYKQLT